MQGHHLVALAAAPTVTTARAITVDQLDAPTPCSAYDVRKLLSHLLYWGPSLEAAAKDVAVAPPTANEQDLDLPSGWAGALEAQFNRIVAAWGEPQAWEGLTRLGGPDPVPAPLIGGMVLTEFVVHGWDLARATGRRPRWDDRVLDIVHREVGQTAEQGREMGVYGPRIPVPDTAPVLDRILGLTGRDPGWRA